MTFNDFEHQPFVGEGEIPVQLDEVTENVNIAANIGLSWQAVDCSFIDWLYLAQIRLGRDQLPTGLEAQLIGSKRGRQIDYLYPAGQLVAGWRPDRQFDLQRTQFEARADRLSPVKARLGRFYPADYFRHIATELEAVTNPCRIVRVNADMLTVDCNHPLSQHEIKLIVQLEAIYPANAGDRQTGRDISAMVCDQGPGMQDRLAQQDRDFFSAECLQRQDEGDDAEFFREPSLNPFWDQTALLEVSRLYQQLIPPQADILDLMAGVHSPLQQTDLDCASVHCAGLNAEELAHNPVCSERQVLNVNQIRVLPYADRQFDVVLIHAAVEYVTQPQLLCREISRVLKPAGRIIISFTNRYLSGKAIRCWTEAYDFERPAIVLSYLRSTGDFTNFSSYSQRGLSRPVDDRLSPGLQNSDPVFLLSADKTMTR